MAENEVGGHHKPLIVMGITLQEHCQRIAKLGGSVKSEKKTEAARKNASKPRPKSRELNKLRRAENKLTNS
jgi:hypothetical protein